MGDITREFIVINFCGILDSLSDIARSLTKPDSLCHGGNRSLAVGDQDLEPSSLASLGTSRPELDKRECFLRFIQRRWSKAILDSR